MMADIHKIMQGVILAGLLFVVKGTAALGNSSHGNLSRTIDPLLSLPRMIIPLPTTITDLPTELQIDTHSDPSLDHTKYPPPKGREGALIYLYQDPFITFADQSLASQCGLSWSSEYSNYIATGAITTFYPGGPKWYYPEWSFTIKPPCCGVCQIDGVSVELSYWPTPAPTPAVTALVNDVGFTFVSPSAYAIFRSLAAYDLCGRVGQTYKNKTLSFGPTELSTSPAINVPGAVFFQYNYNWTAFNYADVTNSNCTNVVVSSGGPETRYYNPCLPFLSPPPQILGLDRRWSTCVQELGAFYDPPRILASVDGLTAVEAAKTAAVDAPQASQKATAGQAAGLPVATLTPANVVPTPSKAHPQANPGFLPSSPPKANPPHDTGPANPKPKGLTPATPTLKDPAPKDPAPKDSTQDIKPGDPKLADPKSKGPDIPNLPNNNPGDPRLPAEATFPSPPDQAPDKAKQPQSGPTPPNGLAPDPKTPADPNPPKQGPGGSHAIDPSPGDPSNPKVPVDSKDPGPDPPSSNQPNHGPEHRPVEQTNSSPGDPNAGNQPNIYVQGLKITEGAPAITQGGKAIAYNSGFLHIGSSAIGVPTLVPSSYMAASTLNGLAFSIVANAPPINPPAVDPNPSPATAAIYVQGVKLAEGAPAITQGGTAIAYSSGYLHVGSSVVAIPKTIPPLFTSAFALGGLSFSVVPSSRNAFQNPSPPEIHVQGLKLTEGGTPITQDGKVIAYSSGYLRVGSSVIGVPTLATPSYASTSVVNGLKFSVLGPRPADVNLVPTPVLTIGHSLITATPNFQIVVAGQTLIAGGRAQTVSGTRLSLAPSASALVIGSSTSLLAGPSQTAAIILTLGSSTYAATLSSNLAVGSQILSPGAVITVGGTPVSLDVQGTDNAIGTGTRAQDLSIGALIMGAFGPSPSGPLFPVVSATPTLSSDQAAPSPPSTTLTIDNIALSLNPTQAIINHTPYPIGPGASPTTVVVGNETISLGPGGVGFPFTTVPVPSAPPGGGPEGFTGGAERGFAGFGGWWWLLGGALGGWVASFEVWSGFF